MSAGTAQEIVTKALRLLTVLDAEESPTATQISGGTTTLNDLMQHEYGDVLSSFQNSRERFTMTARKKSFTIGVGKDIPVDARSVHTIFNSYDGLSQGELRKKTESHIFTTEFFGPTPVKYLTEMKVDGTLEVIIWPTPSQDVELLVSMGLRVAKVTIGEDPVLIPPDAAYSLTYILAARLRPEYGIPLADISDVIGIATQKEAEWKAYTVKNTAVRLRRRR